MKKRDFGACQDEINVGVTTTAFMTAVAIFFYCSFNHEI